MINVELGVWND